MMQTMSFESKRDQSGELERVRRHDDGESGFVSSEKAIELLADAPEIDFEQFRSDIYSVVDPSPRIWFEE